MKKVLLLATVALLSIVANAQSNAEVLLKSEGLILSKDSKAIGKVAALSVEKLTVKDIMSETTQTATALELRALTDQGVKIFSNLIDTDEIDKCLKLIDYTNSLMASQDQKKSPEVSFLTRGQVKLGAYQSALNSGELYWTFYMQIDKDNKDAKIVIQKEEALAKLKELLELSK